MATRRPLSRQVRQLHSPSRPPKPGAKRARSPTLDDTRDAMAKRAKAAADSPHHKRSRADKQQQELEFRQKYTRSMPTWTFNFEPSINDSIRNKVEERITRLGGNVDDFFSKEITHFIVKDIEAAQLQSRPVDVSDKENRFGVPSGSIRQNALRKSPSKQPAQLVEDGQTAFDYAKQWNLKIWDIRKLDSVLSRCLDQPALFPSATVASSKNASHSHTSAPVRSLTRLLQSERIHGTTERDPTQKRHDFTYFSKGSCFVLVEDMRGELATIAAHEYPAPKRGSSKTPWPMLYCDPRSRGPFIAFDEKEKRRWEKMQQIEKQAKKDQEEENRDKLRRFEEAVRMKEAQQEIKRGGGDLRRSVSMINLKRRDCMEDNDLEASNFDSANASGYLASGTGAYMAASGNSVTITSATGTTSTSNNPLRRQLPSALRMLANQEVLTSRKAGGQKASLMGPPPVPERHAILKKSKSTNTLRLSKREEGSKPGYCESCRVRFDDFKQHVKSARHRKFAVNDANFAQLDVVLDRMQRKMRVEAYVDPVVNGSSRGYGQTWDSDSEQSLSDDVLPNLAADPGDVEMEDEDVIDLDDY
ncbi:hypothetical protein D9758_002074 [Tetrapyrgos nigripes]|uniref:DBF4-type domain-containing protein n=1 Tax=Tetrapyrgos nigripes TaxID=182062 RepID=A0A8H5LVA9_9AGAR|nr:hypothetical protein D9758_002074 [Tetrapyrgos nigripes]